MTPLRSASFAVVVSALSVAPVLAGDLYGRTPLAPLMPPTAALADVTNPGYVYFQPDGAGVYNCQLDEKRTRMERRLCGPLKDEPGE